MGADIGILISAFIAYWIIRLAVFGSLKDFEKWKRKRDGGRYEQYDRSA